MTTDTEWVMAPRRPTPEMIAQTAIKTTDASDDDYCLARLAAKLLPSIPLSAPGALDAPDILAEIARDYRAMLSASPPSPRVGGEVLKALEEALNDWRIPDIYDADTGEHMPLADMLARECERDLTEAYNRVANLAEYLTDALSALKERRTMSEQPDNKMPTGTDLAAAIADGLIAAVVVCVSLGGLGWTIKAGLDFAYARWGYYGAPLGFLPAIFVLVFILTVGSVLFHKDGPANDQGDGQ